LVIVAVVIVLLEVWRTLDTLASIHPYLAVAVGVLVAVPLCAWAFRSAWKYGRVPRATAPPNLPPLESGWTDSDRERFRRFAVRWLERQLLNPHLPSSQKERIPEALRDIRDRRDDEASLDSVGAAQALHERAYRWIDEIVRPLDREADRQIRVAAVQVAAATAISPSVLMDSLITLARNLDLMARLADLYYGRPGLVGTLRVARDVLGTAIAAGALEVVTDHVTSTLSEMTGSFASRWLGPIGQGAVNGVLTIRIGGAAKRRCRSLATRRPRWTVPSAAEMRREWRRLFSWIREDLGPAVAGPFSRWLGPEPVAETGAPPPPIGMSDRRRGVFSRWFRRREEQPPTWVDPDEDREENGEEPGD
jgi:hypothetical protein